MKISLISDKEELVQPSEEHLTHLLRVRSVTSHWSKGFNTVGVIIALFLAGYAVFRVQHLSTSLEKEKASLLKQMDEDITKTFENSIKKQFEQKLELAGSMESVDDVSVLEHYKDVEDFIPVMFDCTRTSRLLQRGVINYDTCLVDTTEGTMNNDTGVFIPTKEQAGIYQMSFTAKYVAHSSGRFGAWSDLWVNDKVIADSQREYNGNGQEKTESSTHTMLALFPLKGNDTVKVQFNKDGHSYIHSDKDHDVHFTMRRISRLPYQ